MLDAMIYLEKDKLPHVITAFFLSDGEWYVAVMCIWKTHIILAKDLANLPITRVEKAEGKIALHDQDVSFVTQIEDIPPPPVLEAMIEEESSEEQKNYLKKQRYKREEVDLIRKWISARHTDNRNV